MVCVDMDGKFCIELFDVIVIEEFGDFYEY